MATDYSWATQKPQSAADFAANPTKFDPNEGGGWTRTGGNSTSSVWVNSKTGAVAYVGNDGRVQDTFTSTAAGNAAEGSITDVIPGGGGYKPSAAEISQQDLARQQLADFATQLQTQRDAYGGGTQAGTAPQIGEYGVSAPPAATAPPVAAPAPAAVPPPAPSGTPVPAPSAPVGPPKPVPPTPNPNPNNDPAIAASNTAAQSAYARGLDDWNTQQAASAMTSPLGQMPSAGARGAFEAANPGLPTSPATQPVGTAPGNPGAPAVTGANTAPVAANQPPAPANHGPSIYGGPAASMQAAQSMGAPKIDTGQLGATAQTVAPTTIAAPTQITAPTAGKAMAAPTQQIAQPTAVTAQQVGAQQIGPVGLGSDATANKASQEAAQAMLAGAAAGTAPSAAEALMRKGIDENEGAALGMAATLQGSRPGMALRTGLQGARAATAKSAADMAALRATEQATARGQYVEATTSARGQDIQAASTNLQAQVDTLKANQQTALAAGNTNAANALQAQIQTIQSQLDASKANQTTALQATLATQSTQADLAKANAANALQAQIVSMQQQIDVAKQNAANALAAGQSNQAANLQAQIATMTSQLDGLKANQASALSTATTNAGLTQQANQTNAGLSQDMTKFGATQQLSAAEENQKAQLLQQQLNNNQYMGLTQLQLNANIAPYQAMIQQQQLEAQKAAADQAFWGQIYSSVGTGIAASDMTLKTDIDDGAAAAFDFLDTLDPKTYRYLDEKTHYAGPQLGVIAQDLTPAVVTTGPDGKKWISANVIGQVLAGLGNVHKRLGKVEEHRKTTQLTRRQSGDTVPASDIAEFARKLAS